jgi:hypothetical protein
LHGLYIVIVRTIGGLWSSALAEEPLTEDYLCWLSEEISGLPNMFGCVNKIFATAAIEGALTMVRDSIDLNDVRDVTIESGADILPTGPNVRRAAWAVSKKWWHSFRYDYVLSIICAKQEEVLGYFQLLL